MGSLRRPETPHCELAFPAPGILTHSTIVNSTHPGLTMPPRPQVCSDQSSGGTQLRTAARSRCSRHRRRPGLGWIIYHYHTCWSHQINMTPEYLLLSKSLKVFLALDHKLHIPNMPPGPPYPHISTLLYYLLSSCSRIVSSTKGLWTCKPWYEAKLPNIHQLQDGQHTFPNLSFWSNSPLDFSSAHIFHVQRASDGLYVGTRSKSV